MVNYLVHKSSLQGEIVIPPSKSHTLRAVLFGALAKGRTVIHKPLFSPDTFAMIEACRSLGALIEVLHDHIEISGIDGKITGSENVIDAGNSGLVLRMISAVAALGTKPIVITGDHSIRHRREMMPMIEALSEMGVKAISTKGDGYAPLIIEGPMQKGVVHVLGEDSQFVSSLLLASLFAPFSTEIFVKNPGEKPWVSLTLDWFRRLGISYEMQDFTRCKISGNTSYPGFTYTVPGDFSSAAFPIAAALVSGSELTIHNLQIQDCQGDKELIQVFKKMGALIDIDEKENTIFVKKGPPLEGIEVDINDFIDSITILAVVGCFAKGTTRIKNAAVVRGKECDRIKSIVCELKKMGAKICESGDGLIVEKSSLQGGEVFSYYDHRMAMSLAVAGMGSEGSTKIISSECVKKTYPSFLRDFQSLGAKMEEV